VVVNTALTNTDKRPVLCQRHFWVFAFGIIIVSIVTRVFDFSLMPPSYQRLFITRPYYGLHSWENAHMAWAARSHVKYGLGYTRGYSTPAVGNPPPAHPQRYVSHPSLETLITSFGMLLFGTGEWAIRLFDLILSIPVLLLILLLLRKLYGCSSALLSGLLLVRPWPVWIVQLACTSLAWRTFVNVSQVRAFMP